MWKLRPSSPPSTQLDPICLSQSDKPALPPLHASRGGEGGGGGGAIGRLKRPFSLLPYHAIRNVALRKFPPFQKVHDKQQFCSGTLQSLPR